MASTGDDITQRGLGWRPDPPDQRDFLFSMPFGATRTIPNRFRQGLRWLAPIRDQWYTGSCTAFSGLGAIESKRRKQGLRAMTASPLFTYYATRVDEFGVHGANVDSGATIRGLMRAMARYGLASEKSWPYGRGENWAVEPPQAAWDEAEGRQLLRYARVPQQAQQMAATIYGGHQIVIGFMVYESMMTLDVADTGIIPLPGRWDEPLGGHAVRLVGYDFTDRTFEFANSWGKSWGKAGYGTFGMDYLLNPELAQDFWIAELVES
jgi:C1A family cysteine protease